MKLFLSVDFGSTYTKINLFDLDIPVLLAQAQSYTTVETSILYGFQKAFEHLEEKYPVDFTKIEYIRVCSSAAGGLKVAVIGIVPELTLDAAKKAALGAGARIVKSFSFFLKEEDVKEIEESSCDIVLLAGGSNGGNSEIVLHNAKKLASSRLQVPILYCGNEYIQKEVSEVLQEKILYISKNIMPDVNQLAVEDCRQSIRTIFFQNIIQAKGLEEVSQILHPNILPTPTAVLSCLNILEDKSPVMLIDIGGATTDVHSLAENIIYEKKCLLEGLVEPIRKRTVEGDLGMRYSAMSVLENSPFTPALFSKEEWKAACLLRQENPHFLARSEKEKQADEELAKLCISLAVERHCGTLREGYTVSEKIVWQRGKDFRKLRYLIGTGGILIHSENPKKLLESALQQKGEETLLKPQSPIFLLDQYYLASSLGLLSEEFPEIAAKLFEKYFVVL